MCLTKKAGQIVFAICAYILLSLNSATAQSAVTIRDTQQIELTSNINGQRYFLQVALPWKYEEATESYPVVYLLDANNDFPLITSMARRLQGEELVTNFIVVGLTYPENPWYNRRRDYTPTHESRLEMSGGGPAFKQAILEEIIPTIDANFRTKKGERTLIGHSLGGLFGAYLIATDTKEFSSYIISSPSLWWDNTSTIKNPRAGLDRHKIRALLTVGRDENPHMIEAWQQFIGFTKEQMPSSTIQTASLEGEDHTTAKFRAFANGLRWLFKR